MPEKIRRPVGAPRAYTPEKLQKAVNRYFASISRIVPVMEETTVGEDENGLPIKAEQQVINMLGEPMERVQYIEKPSIQALCIFLKICKDTWAEYSKLEDYSRICAAAKLEIERDRVSRLGCGKGDHGIEFDLKHNFGWKDNITVEAGEQMQKALEAKPVSMDEQLALLKAMGLRLPGEE